MRETVKNVIRFFPGVPRKIDQINVAYKLTINHETVQKILNFSTSALEKMNSVGLGEKVVVGMSGGLDSTLTIALLKKAIGRNRVLGVIVDVDSVETEKAVSLGREMGVDYQVISARNLIRKYSSLISQHGPFTGINIETRAVHSIIFQVADGEMASVASTIDRSENLIFRHMEYFYGQLAPLIGLYKTEVVDLASFLGVPTRVVNSRPGCKNWWWDDEIFGVGYDILDPVLYLMSEKNLTAKQIAKEYQIDENWLCKIESRLKNQRWRFGVQALSRELLFQ
jgi:NAD+ synthase